MFDIKESRAYGYALKCVNDTDGKVPYYVKKQASQWLEIADGKSEKAQIKLSNWGLITKILKLMVHPDLMCDMEKGLEDYAHFLIYAVFCTVKTEDGSRYYTTALLEIARKNFKTFTSGVIFIVGMLIEPKFSRFFSVAPDYKLSSELRLAVRKIIKSSPALVKHFKINRDMISCKLNEIEYTPLAYSNDRMDGKLANIFLADEAGALDSYPVEAMRSSQITLHNKLGIIISTQYPNDNNVMIDEIDIAKKNLDGLIDSRVFALLYEPDMKIQSKWQTDDRAIYQANPVSVHNETIFEALKDMRTMAILYENKRENFLCKHLNIMYKSLGTEGFVGIDIFKKCRIETDPDFWKGKDVYIGLDLSQTDDNTSVAMVTYYEGEIYGQVWGFYPKGREAFKSHKEGVDYPALCRQGACFATGGEYDEVIDYGEVERFVMSLPERYGVNIVQLGYDRYNAISSVKKFESADEPIECVEIRQHSSVLHPATKLFYEYILSKKFRYFNNKLLEINIQNARCTFDTNMNRYVNKKKSSGKVDMVVSLINAIYLLNVNELLSDEEDFGAQV